MDSLSDQFLKAAGRHFVSLSCAEMDENQEPIRVFVFSAFVIEIGEEWILFTAGHVLTAIKYLIASGLRLSVWRLGDQTGNRKFGSGSIPFDFNEDEWLAIDNQDLGIDCAIVPVRMWFRAALEAGGITPIRQNVWGNPWTDDFDRRVLIGIPAETVEYDGDTLIKVKISLAPMKPSATPPFTEQKAQNQFYSKLDDDPEGTIRSLKGMSGGPIFSCRRDGDQLHYRLLGVQSSWYPENRIAAGCPVVTFVQALLETLAEHGQEPE